MAALRKSIAALGGDKSQRRYDERLAKQIVAHARVRQAAGAAQRIIAEELGISQPTLPKMLRRESKLIPVKVVADSKGRSGSREYVMRGPGGVTVEGLSLGRARRALVEARLMFGRSRRLRVFVHAGPRRPAQVVLHVERADLGEWGHDVLNGDVYLFIGKNRKSAKALWFDGTSLVLLAKRLERGWFAAVWERANGGPARSADHERADGLLRRQQGLLGRRSSQNTFTFDVHP